MWQEILSGIVVTGAVFFLVRRFFFNKGSKGGCAECGSGSISDKTKKSKGYGLRIRWHSGTDVRIMEGRDYGFIGLAERMYGLQIIYYQ